MPISHEQTAFTSSAVGGKTGRGELTAVGTNAGNDWKLTLFDNSRKGFTASCIKDENCVCTIRYSGATTGTNEKISAAIVNQSNEIVYYGAICDAQEGENTFTLDLAGKYADGDTLYVFNEQTNGDYRTDFTSSLVEIPNVCRKPGDADADGQTDLRDVAALSRWLVGGWGVSVSTKNVDVNADGVIDLKDVVLIRRFLAGGWNVTLV